MLSDSLCIERQQQLARVQSAMYFAVRRQNTVLQYVGFIGNSVIISILTILLPILGSG